MNRLATIILISTFVGLGCAGNAKKNTMEPAPATAADTPKVYEKVKPAAKVEAIKTGQTKGKFNCSSKGDVRVLDVREVDKGCELMYTKAGNDSIVATAQNNGTAHCETVAEKIKSKLTDAGFSCD